jgi:hypothetical protein
MQVYSYRTSGWMETQPHGAVEGGTPSDGALDEIRRALSDCLRCRNLVVLTGLGTSLHVNVDDVLSIPPGRVPIQGRRLAPTMADLWARVRASTGRRFDEVLRLARYPIATEGENIESLLSFCKVAENFVTAEEGKETITRFITEAEACVRDEVRFLDPQDDVGIHSDFLRRLVRRSSRKPRPKLFTVNYDLCFEHAARQGRYVVVDGFSHTTPQVFDSLYFSYDIVKRAQESDGHDFIPNVFLLYKLHGSIDWTLNKATGEIEKDPHTDAPLLVYPRSTKYQLAFEQPYIEMMAALQAALRQQDTGLLVLGFGFSDNHIAEPILSAIRSNLGLKVAICDPSLAARTQAGEEVQGRSDTNPFLRQVRALIAQGDARLALINATFQEIVPELPDIVAQTDLEQHMDRLRQGRAA